MEGQDSKIDKNINFSSMSERQAILYFEKGGSDVINNTRSEPRDVLLDKNVQKQIIEDEKIYWDFTFIKAEEDIFVSKKSSMSINCQKKNQKNVSGYIS